MLLDLIKLSVKNLSQRKLRAYLTMLGIFIGIAAVVSLIGLGEGLRVAINAQFGSLGSDKLTIQASGMGMSGPPGSGVSNPLSDELAEKIEKISGVKSSFNRHIKYGTLEYKDFFSIGFAMDMPEEKNRDVAEEALNLEAEQGRLLKDGDKRKALLGNAFSQEPLSIKAGDSILLSDMKYEVIGILEKKGNFMLDQAVIINTETLLEDFGDDGTTNLIVAQVEDVKQINKVKEDIEKFMRKERDVKEGEEDFEVQTPQATLESLDQTLFAINLFVIIIASISLVVGGIGIMNTMYTSVLERTKEIGILKSIGSKNSSIFLLFFFESGFLGMVGGLIGILLGVFFAYTGAAIGRAALGADLIQASISPTLIFGSLAFSFLLGTLAGLIPAYQASAKHPVDALRFTK